MIKAVKRFLFGRGIDKMQEFLSKALRHGMTTGGGVLVTLGYADSSDVTTAVGAAMTLLGFAVSVIRSYIDQRVL